MALPNTNTVSHALGRVRILYGGLLLIVAIFGVRLFYVQVIRYDHYKSVALSDQLKQYQIPADRGLIEAYSGGQVLPIVLNQTLYTVYADPTFVTQPEKVAAKLVEIFGGKYDTYLRLLRAAPSRYAVLAKKASEQQKQQLLALKYKGIGATPVSYRTYPQGSLASQTLGFVSDNGTGEYGLEQALNKQLGGKPGELKAITDASGIPLAASKDNIQIAPKNGETVVLGLDLALQQQLETILAGGVKNSKADSGSAIIMDANTGQIKAIANVPTFDPAKYFDVSDPTVFQSAAVADPIEIGSIMKSFTTASALDQGVIAADTSYYDPSFRIVDGFRITNIEEDGGAGTRTLKDILNLSLNTGATWELMQMGGGDINTKARNAWYDYMTKHYRFGQATGIEQGYEATGYIPTPVDNGAGIDLTYANTAFGQAMTATPIQTVAALAAVVNGGTYYQPHLIDKTIDADGTEHRVLPKVLESNTVSTSVSQTMLPLMQYVVDHHYFTPGFDQSQYVVGGKTGTAQIAKPGGGYYDDQFNGTYLGFVGGDKPQYVITVFVKKPKNGGYAGTAAAQPIFGSIAHMLINESVVTPRSR